MLWSHTACQQPTAVRACDSTRPENQDTCATALETCSMVLERFQRLWRRDGDSLNFDNPNAYRSGEYADCLSCRVLGKGNGSSKNWQRLTPGIGSTALVSLGGYTYYSGMKGLREREQIIKRSKSKFKYGGRQLGVVMLSGTLISMGLYRTFN